LFGFLTKPCAPEALGKALDRALDQHALVMAERDLLERTVRGAVDMLTELVASSSPLAFARTTRIKELAEAISPALGLDREWELPLASRLSQVGCLAVPIEVLGRVYSGTQMTDEDRALYAGHRGAAQAMLERIPRLEEVARWVGGQPLVVGEAPPPEAGAAQSVFCAVVAMVTAYEATDDAAAAFSALKHSGHYGSEVLAAINHNRDVLTRSAGVLRNVTVAELREGMELVMDVVTGTGMTLVRKGEPMTETLVVRLRNFSETVGIVEPIQVIDYWRSEG
jgi:hypothetical protein